MRDKEERFKKFIPETIKLQIAAIRDSKEVNIHQIRAVMGLAQRKGFTDLADWLPSHQNDYWLYIMQL